MLLVVGGLGAGKRAFLRTLGYSDAQMSRDFESACPVLLDLEDIVRGREETFETLLPMLLKKEAISCREVGCGVIPIDEKEAAWREAVGRMCCRLAERASCVVRVQCGLPVYLKGAPREKS